MNLGVLLLSCKGEARVTTLTKDWVQKMTAHVADYLFAQSGGRVKLTFQVFDWFELQMTGTDWNDLQFNAGPTVRPLVAAGLKKNLDAFDHMALVIDKDDAHAAATVKPYSHMGAQDLTPAILSHELSHVFGCDDSFLNTPEGPARYDNLFCIMGREGAKYSFVYAPLALPAEANPNEHAMSGPGMTAPTLMANGWLNLGQSDAARDLTNGVGPAGLTVELASLRGAPGPNYQGLPLVAWLDIAGGQRVLIEYRGRDESGWDRGIPDAGPDAGGWVVVHRTPQFGPVMNLQIGSVRAAVGQGMPLADEVFDLFSPGPVRLTVAGFNRTLDTVILRFTRRSALLPSGGVLYGGIEAGGPGLVWTPGGGFTPFPPHSPLIFVLDLVVRLQVLHDLATRHVGTPQAEGILHAARQTLAGLQDTARHLGRVLNRDPLAEAMESLVDLQELQRQVVAGHGESPQLHTAADEVLERLHESVSLIAAEHARREASR